MKYFLDTEFHERQIANINTIELISIGIVSEDGREFYAVSSDFNLDAAERNEWLNKNVIAHLGKEKDQWYSNDTIAATIRAFIGVDDNIQFYGYFSDYDWVVFCWLFGRMIDLPDGFPFYCMDLKQMMEERGLTKEWKKENCPDPEGEHNALVDAKWNYDLFKKITAHDLKPMKLKN